MQLLCYTVLLVGGAGQLQQLQVWTRLLNRPLFTPLQ